jgi:hypothetical protein
MRYARPNPRLYITETGKKFQINRGISARVMWSDMLKKNILRWTGYRIVYTSNTNCCLIGQLTRTKRFAKWNATYDTTSKWYAKLSTAKQCVLLVKIISYPFRDTCVSGIQFHTCFKLKPNTNLKYVGTCNDIVYIPQL